MTHVIDADFAVQVAEAALVRDYLSSGWREHLSTGGGLAGSGYALPSAPYRDPSPLPRVCVARSWSGRGDADLAAAEIHRVGEDQRIARIVLAFPPVLLGDRSLRPLFAAAEELELPVSFQAGGAFAGSNPGPAAVGHPTTLFEYRVDSPYAVIPHLVSILCEGLFDRFPA